MSLFDTGDRQDITAANFKQAALIPKDEQCESCEGRGVVRWRHSWTGPDYKVCFTCHGNGRKDAGK